MDHIIIIKENEYVAETNEKRKFSNIVIIN